MYSPTQLLLIYIGLFCAAAVFSLLINSLFMRFAHTLGIRDHGDLVRWSASSKPAFGGIGFFIIFLGSFSVYTTIFPKLSDPLQPELLGLLAATGLAFLMGLADDAYNTRPLLKFMVQVICGIVLILSGSSIQLFEHQWLNWLITVFWVVGMMNSINMLDNMDAITSVVSIFILACGLVVHLLNGGAQSLQMVIIVGVMAAVAGFLFFNWNPSRMYMGDTGSQFLGVYLAFVGVQCFWNEPARNGTMEPMRQVVTTLIVFLLPIVDTTTVTINRILRGRSPFVGGRDHTTHHMSYAGLTDQQVAMIFGALGTLSLFFTFVIVRLIPVWKSIHTVVFIVYAVLLFGLLFGLTKLKRSTAPKE